MVAGGIRIGRLHEHGARSGDLEGHIAQGRDALAVGHDRSLELQLAAARHDRVGLAAADEEVVTDHLLLDGTGEVLRIRKVPGLVAFEDVQGEVLGLLHERGPPLGRTHLLVGDLAVGEEVEEAARGVVARIGIQDGTASLAEREVVGEVDDVAGIVLRQVVEPVVLRGEAHVARRDVLGVGASEDGLAGEVQEQVVLEGELARSDLEAEHARVVRVVHEVQVLQGVVLEHELADGTRVETDEGAHALPDRVVHEGELVHGRGLADVEDVAAHGAVGVDVVDVVAVVGHLTQHHVVAPLVDETLGVVRDHAVLVGDVADVLVLHGTAVLVLDGETVTGRSEGGGTAVELDAFEVQVGARRPVVGEMELAIDDRLGAVGTLLTEEREAVGDVQGPDFIRGAVHLQEDLRTGGLDGVQEGVRGGHFRRSVHVRRRPGIHLAAARGEIVEGEHVFRGRGQAAHRGDGRVDVGGGERHGAGGIFTRQPVFDPVHIDIVRDVLGPREGHAGGGTVGDFQEEVVLHREGLEGLLQEAHLGVLLAGRRGLHGAPVGLVGLQFLLERDLVRKDGLAQVFLRTGRVGIDAEDVGLGVLAHVPGKGDDVTQGRAHAGVQALRSQAAVEIQFGDLVELLRHARGGDEGGEGENGISDLFHRFHDSRGCHSHSRS